MPPTRYTRRLSDHVLIAFHHACDQDDIVVARRLLKVLDFMVRRPPPGLGGRERRAEESLVAAYERLWHLKRPEAFQSLAAPKARTRVTMPVTSS